jgi:hypothetical protein
MDGRRTCAGIFALVAMIVAAHPGLQPRAQGRARTTQSTSQTSTRQAESPLSETTDPRKLYGQLSELRLGDSRVYEVRDLVLRRDALTLHLSEGKLAFFAPREGDTLGAVFSGRGRVISAPRDPVEKLSLVRFVGLPVLDQEFSSVYFRFTDGTAAEMKKQIQESGAQPAADPAFVEGWEPAIAELNSWHSLRSMMDLLAASPRPYFYAHLTGGPKGPFEVLVDPRRREPVLIGQAHSTNGEKYYDVWASLPRNENQPPFAEDFDPIGCEVTTKINADLSIEGEATIRLRAHRAGERMLLLDLSHLLGVESVTSEAGQPMDYFQNEDLRKHGITKAGGDVVTVVLPRASAAGESFALHLRYRGTVIGDAGNRVYFVGERAGWYPHVGGGDHFQPFVLNFRWPRRLVLVVTGDKKEEHAEGDWQTGRWETQQPAAVVGFNLGEYVTETAEANGLRVNLFANHEFEATILARMQAHAEQSTSAPPGVPPQENPDRRAQVVLPPPPPSPSAILQTLGDSMIHSISYLESLNGPFPFDHLDVSQIPGSFGQGWPGLLYLSTLVFLPPSAQQEAGISAIAQAQVADLMPYHEAAHQWWGNVTGAASYRDTWILESMANYEALLYADNRKKSAHTLATWLGHFQEELATHPEGSDTAYEQAGPLALGYRLASSKAPEAYDAVLYGKGTWVIHMLRMMLQNPGAADPDARFKGLLKNILDQYRFEPLSTAEFQQAVEHVMTPQMNADGTGRMDWFFDEWVRGTGIPVYAVSFRALPHGNACLVRGVLKQEAVPNWFTEPVPLYAMGANGKQSLLGTVTTSGGETAFTLRCAFAPTKLSIDPQHTILRSTR